MSLEIIPTILERIHSHGEAAYPEEGAGLLLGELNQTQRRVIEIVTLANTREESARHNRYLLSSEDYLKGEEQASRLGLEVLGVFHSHPHGPAYPSSIDRAQIVEPDWVSVIVAAVEAPEPIIRAFRVRSGDVTELDVITTREGLRSRSCS